MNATSPADGSKSSRPAGRKVCPRDPPCWAASPTSVLPCGRLPGSPELEGGGRAPSALSLADGAMKPFRKIAPEYFRRCSTARLASPAALVLPAAEGQSAAPGPPRRPAPGGGTRFGAWNHPDFRGALRCARRAPPPPPAHPLALCASGAVRGGGGRLARRPASRAGRGSMGAGGGGGGGGPGERENCVRGRLPARRRDGRAEPRSLAAPGALQCFDYVRVAGGSVEGASGRNARAPAAHA